MHRQRCMNNKTKLLLIISVLLIFVQKNRAESFDNIGYQFESYPIKSISYVDNTNIAFFHIDTEIFKGKIMADCHGFINSFSFKNEQDEDIGKIFYTDETTCFTKVEEVEHYLKYNLKPTINLDFENHDVYIDIIE